MGPCWERGFCRIKQAKIRSLVWASISYDGVLIRRRNLDIDKHVTSHNDKARDKDEASISQGTPKSTSKPSQAVWGAGRGLSPVLLGRNQACWHLGLRLRAPVPVRRLISAVGATRSWPSVKAALRKRMHIFFSYFFLQGSFAWPRTLPIGA